MSTHPTSFLILFLALITSACGSSMKKPDIKQNPHPKMRYEITMTIDGAPGRFDSITGSADYTVANDRCVPLTPISGATIAPEKSIPFALTRVSDGVYKGTIYADLLQDEDYYGMGVCHWKVAASADLKIKATDFGLTIFTNDIVQYKPVVWYFLKGDYLEADNKKRTASSTTNRSLYQPESRTDIFSITLVAGENFP